MIADTAGVMATLAILPEAEVGGMRAILVLHAYQAREWQRVVIQQKMIRDEEVEDFFSQGLYLQLAVIFLLYEKLLFWGGISV